MLKLVNEFKAARADGETMEFLIAAALAIALFFASYLVPFHYLSKWMLDHGMTGFASGAFCMAIVFGFAGPALSLGIEKAGKWAEVKFSAYMARREGSGGA